MNYHVVIVGGGTAGWFTAGWLSKFRKCSVTLVESPGIKKIDVGESVTPHVQRFFDLLGLETKDWMLNTGAIYKYANKFVNWVDNQGENEYFGFSYSDKVNQDIFEKSRPTDIFLELFKNKKLDKFDRYFHELYPYMENNTMPYVDGQYQPSPFYSWSQHINAELAGSYVRDQIAIPRGVSHIKSTVKKINHNGETIESLVLDDGSEIFADLFVDCTGFKGLLVNELEFERIDYRDNLIDSAWVCQVDYRDEISDMVNYTQSIAQDYGWLFKIGLYHRMGTGYCFSSKHLSPHSALDDYRKMVPLNRGEPRLITWTPSRLSQSAKGNLVSIGLSSGFVEPLEANALFIITASIFHLDKVLDHYENTLSLDFEKFNEDVGYLIDDIADFLRVHYTLSNRRDTTFWRDQSLIRNLDSEKELVKEKYFSDKGSILHSANYKTVFPNYMWLQLAISWGLDISDWNLNTDKDLLESGIDFYKKRFHVNNEKSFRCDNTYIWLKENIFQKSPREWEGYYFK